MKAELDLTVSNARTENANEENAMPAQAKATQSDAQKADFETIVIGAGFGGVRAIHKMKELGLSVLCIEAGSDVGGTWYWNRYPGARTDSEAWAYCFSFSKELQDEWDWPERMPTWDQVQAYLGHVTDRFNLRENIEFNTKVCGAAYDEDRNLWTVSTEDGRHFTCTYLVSAVGWFAIACEPPVKGLEIFKGSWHMSSSWPKTTVDFTGKRVGIVGSGSTAVQILPVVAQNAAQVYLFQRTPNYVLPGRNHPLDDAQRNSIKQNYDAIWKQVRSQVFAFPMETSHVMYDDVDDQERQQIFEFGWEAGGFRFLFETFADILVDTRSNAAAAEFVRNKIRAIVKDKATAELLTPKYPIALKRPPLGNFYYESFNRPNVTLVDVSKHALKEATPNGLSTGVAHYDLDIIIFATGFDAVTGPLMHMNLRGRGGISMKEKWEAGPRSHLGITVDGFPNMFMITGPQTPFSNVPPVVEASVDWIGKIISKMRSEGTGAAEPTEAAVQDWIDVVQATLDATLLAEAVEYKSWFMGANVPGKAHAPLHYFGGAEGYFNAIQANIDSGFSGLALKAPSKFTQKIG